MRNDPDDPPFAPLAELTPDPVRVAVAGWLEALKTESPPFELAVWNRLHAAADDLITRLHAAS